MLNVVNKKGKIMTDYITEDLNPESIAELVEGIYQLTGEEDPSYADLDSLIFGIGVLRKWVDEVAKPAADALIDVHQRTGIDLKHWEPVLRFAQSVRPAFSIEGEPEW